MLVKEYIFFDLIKPIQSGCYDTSVLEEIPLNMLFELIRKRKLATFSIFSACYLYFNSKEQRKQVGHSFFLPYKMIPLKTFSRLSAFLNSFDLPISFRNPVLGAFCKFYGVKNEFVGVLQDYPNLQAFFTRKLDLKYRKLANAELVSPVDGKVLHYGPVTNQSVEQVKDVEYSVPFFLGTKLDPTRNYYHLILYLAPGDYHRFHSPVDFTVRSIQHFSGELFSVSPLIANILKGLFVLNERISIIGEWKHGFFSMTPVGATGVGSIRLDSLSFKKEQKKILLEKNISKFTEVGYFELGSTVVLLFEAPTDFHFNVINGEQVQLGQSLGNY